MPLAGYLALLLDGQAEVDVGLLALVDQTRQRFVERRTRGPMCGWRHVYGSRSWTGT